MASPEPAQIPVRDDGRLPPGTLVGNYRLIDCIGEGSFALVYRAQHATLEREVAIKILRAMISEEDSFRERFRREAVSAAKVVSPNVVSVFDFGETTDGLPYLVMEWVKGTTLHRAVAEKQPFPPERIAHLLRQIAHGLSSAHKLGLVHRDLKSGNVMLAEVDDPSAEAAKIVDFGLVRATFDEARLTQAGQVLGTPQFMDPEMIIGREVTASADLYALGVIGFQMLTGKLPFSGKTPIDVMRKQVTESPPPLPEARGLEGIVADLMQKESRLRPPTAEAVVHEIDMLRIPAWCPTDPEMLRTVAGAPDMFETTPVVTAPRIAMLEPPIPMPRVETVDRPVATRVGSYGSLGQGSNPPTPSDLFAVSYAAPRRARWLVAGVLLAALAVIAAAFARWRFEQATPAPIVVTDSPPGVVVEDKPSAEAHPVAHASNPAVSQDPEPPSELKDGKKAVPRPKKEAPSADAAKEKRAPAPADIGSLRPQLDRALDERGLDLRDLSGIDALAPKYERFESAIKAHDPAEGQVALASLRAELEKAAIPVSLLRTKLKRVSLVLEKAKDALPPADFARLETEFLDLQTAVQPGIKDADAVALAKRIKKLDISLRAQVH